ncbi:amino acid transporter [Schizopora paradoxa]|uniref:Amino acid transporter n=1 Tax=Schizopora paradoxa TaxID=27342 RepID=A0A0H2RC59_9AGAM|nr:amino acid transporter [Schizopora paradoxa]
MSDSEATPLLRPNSSPSPNRKLQGAFAREPVDGETYRSGEDDVNGETYDNVPKTKRELGLFSSAFLIFNGIVGAGIYATPSVILRASGSVGMSLVFWVLGAIFASAATAVFIELGTGLPRSGSHKNYLEYIYQRPKFLVTCLFSVFAAFVISVAANGVIVGEYLTHALNIQQNVTNARLFAVLALTLAFLAHGISVRVGLRLQNLLGTFVLVLLLCIAISGGLSILKFPGFEGGDGGKNFQLDRIWEGTSLRANGLVTGLYAIMWSYNGYASANAALSEVRDPVKTLKRAAPLALVAVTALYLLVNIAYFVVIPKNEIMDSKRVVVALFARHLFGEVAERIVSALVAISVFGNMLATTFMYSRLIQELGREGVLPAPGWFSSNKPFGTPFAALFWQWLVCCVTATAPPPGDAFNFIMNLSQYRWTITGTAISAGVLVLDNPWLSRTISNQAKLKWNWEPPFRAWTSAKLFFFLSNVFLFVVPLVPPVEGFVVYEHLPYWMHVAVCFLIFFVGWLYWYLRWRLLPRRSGYTLDRVVIEDDGITRREFVKFYN